MNAQAHSFPVSKHSTSNRQTVSIRDTHYGFVARRTGRGAWRAQEYALKAVSLVMLPVGAAMAFFAMGGTQSEMSFAELGLPFAVLTVGLALFLHANRGFCPEMQVDALNREIRTGVANAQGNFTCRKVFRSRDIDSAFLTRSKSGDRASTLNLRLRGRARPVQMMEASEASLQPIFERTTEALTARPIKKIRPKPKRRRSILSMPLWKKRAQSFDN